MHHNKINQDKMKENLLTKSSNNLRKEYVPPLIQVYIIQMEENIATGSANINPGNGNPGTVKEEWVEGTVENKEIYW